MANYTAGDQINRALRLIGVLAEGEVPSSDTSNDALIALNQMIDSWSTESLSMFTTMEQVFNWPANQATQKIGPTGDFIGSRPVVLDDSTYFVVNNISYNVELINQGQYDALTLKTASSPFPTMLFYNSDFPNASITLYPVPSQQLAFHFVSMTPLTQPPTLATVLAFPPGYLEAFAYNLACVLAAEFGVEPSKMVQRIATSSKRNVKRINGNDDIMGMPAGISKRVGGSNILAGN